MPLSFARICRFSPKFLNFVRTKILYLMNLKTNVPNKSYTLADVINKTQSFPTLRPGTERLLAVNISQTIHDNSEERRDLYEKTRKYWRVNIKRAQQADFVLGYVNNIVVSVVKPHQDGWYPAQYQGQQRSAFKGELVDDSPYLYKDISQWTSKGQRAERYINF